ncbi:UNVERIFIED_CONTAM: hypothetical protein Sradi_0693200 [Sesamum radiatum]|uniref:Uncharacterized protein n=1 Tax=Sesamum radiatum TaxID=300843 RepID=A0AAW2VN70_SESRA
MDLWCVLFAEIMFSKYFRDYAEREKGGSTPPARLPKGTPVSSSLKGKRPMSPPTGTPTEGSAKRTRASSLGTPPISSFKPSAIPPPPPPPPPVKDDKGGFLSALSLLLRGFVHSFFLYPGGGGGSSLAVSLMRGVVTPEDQHLLAPLGREDLERKTALYLLRAKKVSDELA